MNRKWIAVVLLIAIISSMTACGIGENASTMPESNTMAADEKQQNSFDRWNPKSYEELDDIICVTEQQVEDASTMTYQVRYQSGDCEVVAYLSIPNACLKEKKAYPCIIFNRGGNREYGANTAQDIASMAETSQKIVFASQYRGVDGGTGTDEFGGADLQDVLKLIDFCDEFSFVDMDELYMMGISRGGMMTYMAIREDSRIKKGVVVSGLADAFMGYEERADMRSEVFEELIGGTPQELPEKYEKRSATYWADELKCPLLIIHSKQDEQVPFEQAEKMASCMESAGKEYKLVTYEDDVHGLHPEDFEIIMDWLK